MSQPTNKNDEKSKLVKELVGHFERLLAPIIAIIVIFFTFGIFRDIMEGTISKENRDIVMILIGVLSGAITTILGYYYGSSQKGGK